MPLHKDFRPDVYLVNVCSFHVRITSSHWMAFYLPNTTAVVWRHWQVQIWCFRRTGMNLSLVKRWRALSSQVFAYVCVGLMWDLLRPSQLPGWQLGWVFCSHCCTVGNRKSQYYSCSQLRDALKWERSRERECVHKQDGTQSKGQFSRQVGWCTVNITGSLADIGHASLLFF